MEHSRVDRITVEFDGAIVCGKGRFPVSGKYTVTENQGDARDATFGDPFIYREWDGTFTVESPPSDLIESDIHLIRNGFNQASIQVDSVDMFTGECSFRGLGEPPKRVHDES